MRAITVAADFSAVFGGTVVITGDGARADIGVGADRGVAEISQVIGFGAGFDHRFLDLDEIANARAFAEAGARTKPREWPD